MKPLDRNTQIGRLYDALKEALSVEEHYNDGSAWISTSDVSMFCGGWDEGCKKFHGFSYAPSTKISQLKERLPAGEQIRHKKKIVKGKPVHFYRLEKIK